MAGFFNYFRDFIIFSGYTVKGGFALPNEKRMLLDED
jgi:hypothetical protein